MKEITQYFAKHEMIQLVMLFVIALMGAGLLFTIENIIKRLLRFFIMLRHGYPPVHCDADGDQVEQDDKIMNESALSEINIK